MRQVASAIQYRSLPVPAQSGHALCEPPLSEAPACLEQNRLLRSRWQADIQGCPLQDLLVTARRELLEQASAYTSRYRDVPPPNFRQEVPVILAGHQPNLVHPGVWFKNFALSELAATTSAQVINLLIDNDAVRTTAVRVPSGSAASPRLVNIPFDRALAEIPFEERQILDRDCFQACGQRVVETLQTLIPDPLIKQFWPLAIQASEQHGNLGRAIAQARHALEAEWGLTSLELPLSEVCRNRTFRWFTAHLLQHVERLRSCHNACLDEYRQVNGVRSHTHPVPNLTTRDGWTEGPFWIWHSDDPQRRPVFARRSGECIELTDFERLRTCLRLTEDRDAADAVDQLGQLEAARIRLRPRALITTMFARLLLSDLFLHGIGGAKYDQLTDAIIRRFFGLEPPSYLVISATFRLPIPHTSVEPGDMVRVDQMMRELRYHPEVYVPVTPETAPWIKEKRRVIQQDPLPRERRARHQRIETANQALQPFLQPRYQQLRDQRQALRAGLRSSAILDSREYPFCLFPAESLVPHLIELARST